jgi:hypothetical protein
VLATPSRKTKEKKICHADNYDENHSFDNNADHPARLRYPVSILSNAPADGFLDSSDRGQSSTITRYRVLVVAAEADLSAS